MNLLTADFELLFLPTVIVGFVLILFAAVLADSQDAGYIQRTAAAEVQTR